MAQSTTVADPSSASGFRSGIAARVEAARRSPAWANYQRAREAVLAMMDDWERLDPSGGPSDYWREEVEGILYLFDASPLVVAGLREHCHHVTGIKAYDYRPHHAHQAPDYVAKYQLLRSTDPEGLFVPEPEALGGFGFEVGDGLANLDTLKFYEVMLGLEKTGLLARYRNEDGPRRVVAEIGGGWGGFAYQFKTLRPNTTFVCLDLPPTLLFAAVYLMTLFPHARVLLYGEPGFEENLRQLKTYDFVFLPHYCLAQLPEGELDLAINMVSFQEMTTDQVEGYARALRALGCRRLYSLNRNRSKHNAQLTTVEAALGGHYRLTPVEVCELPYTRLTPPKRAPEPTDTSYRHFYGCC